MFTFFSFLFLLLKSSCPLTLEPSIVVMVPKRAVALQKVLIKPKYIHILSLAGEWKTKETIAAEACLNSHIFAFYWSHWHFMSSLCMCVCMCTPMCVCQWEGNRPWDKLICIRKRNKIYHTLSWTISFFLTCRTFCRLYGEKVASFQILDVEEGHYCQSHSLEGSHTDVCSVIPVWSGEACERLTGDPD